MLVRLSLPLRRDADLPLAADEAGLVHVVVPGRCFDDVFRPWHADLVVFALDPLDRDEDPLLAWQPAPETDPLGAPRVLVQKDHVDVADGIAVGVDDLVADEWSE